MEYEPSEHLIETQVKELWQPDQAEWWTTGRQLDDVRPRLPATDLVVAPSHRGRGLGAALLNSILEHPSLKLVQQLALDCLPEPVEFYPRWGFTTGLGKLRFMQRTQ